MPQRPSLILTEVSPSAAYDSGEMRAVGYSRNIALRAEPDHAKTVLMSYIDESLVPGEVLIHRARVSWWSQFGLLFLGILTLVVGVGLIFLIWAWVRVRSSRNAGAR